MLTGFWCYNPVPKGATLNVSLAKERIGSSSFFFGITDRWHESICLFHAWFMNTSRTLRTPELGNMRPTRRKQVDFPADYRDLDFELYEYAIQLFEERLVRSDCLGARYVQAPDKSWILQNRTTDSDLAKTTDEARTGISPNPAML